MTQEVKEKRLTIQERFNRLSASERLEWLAEVMIDTEESPAWTKVLTEAGNAKHKTRSGLPRGERVLAALAANRWNHKTLAKERVATAA